MVPSARAWFGNPSSPDRYVLSRRYLAPSWRVAAARRPPADSRARRHRRSQRGSRWLRPRPTRSAGVRTTCRRRSTAPCAPRVAAAVRWVIHRRPNCCDSIHGARLTSCAYERVLGLSDVWRTFGGIIYHHCRAPRRPSRRCLRRRRRRAPTTTAVHRSASHWSSRRSRACRACSKSATANSNGWRARWPQRAASATRQCSEERTRRRSSRRCAASAMVC